MLVWAIYILEKGGNSILLHQSKEKNSVVDSDVKIQCDIWHKRKLLHCTMYLRNLSEVASVEELFDKHMKCDTPSKKSS